MFLFLVASLFSIAMAQFDCQKLICNPCRTEAVPVDIIFIIDASPSMQPFIDRVKSGLQALSTSINDFDVVPRMWTVLTGGNDKNGKRTELVIGGDDGLTDPAELSREFGKIKAWSSVSGFQESRGGAEPCFEAIRMALNEAAFNIFDHKNIGGSGRINLRPDSKKLIFSLTDEDSDRPLYKLNRRPYGFPDDDDDGVVSRWSYVSGRFAEELKATVNAVANRDASLFMFARSTQGKSKQQFGDPDCDESASDFSQFDKDATLDCLRREGVGLSLTGALLSSGKLARVFNVLDITRPGFVESFFTEAVRSVAKCQLRKKRDVEQDDPNLENCVRYRCAPERGCFVEFLCEQDCNQCDIGGKCYRVYDQNPAKTDTCEFCIPTRSRTRWSTCSGPVEGDSCREYNCIAPFGYCGAEPVCTAACQRCQIDNTCWEKDWKNPEIPCQSCQPDQNQSGWTDECPKCEPACANDGVCEGEVAGAKTCNCAGTGFTGASCEREPVCNPPCQNGGKCTEEEVCDCEGLDFDGAACDNCVMNCQAPTIECTPACQNGGVCDTAVGQCQCAGTGFEGAVCETMSAVVTGAPTASPADDSAQALCNARCGLMCGDEGIASCNCDEMNNVNVLCTGMAASATLTPACQLVCSEACVSGFEACDCDPMTLLANVQCRNGNGASALQVTAATVLAAVFSLLIALN